MKTCLGTFCDPGRRHSTQRARPSTGSGRALMVSLSNHAVFAAFAFSVCVGCGKKGPPLPPLVKLPVPPADLAAQRRGDTVDLQFTLPSANTDGTKPANVAVVDVYAVTMPPVAPGPPAIPGAPALTDTELL